MTIYDEEKTYGYDCKIYKVTSPYGTYIGSTRKTLEKRFAQHAKNAENGGRRKFIKCIRDHGASKFKIQLIEEFRAANRTDHLSREAYYICKEDTLKKGLNSSMPIRMTTSSEAFIRIQKELGDQTSENSLSRIQKSRLRKTSVDFCKPDSDDDSASLVDFGLLYMSGGFSLCDQTSSQYSELWDPDFGLPAIQKKINEM